MNSSCVFCRILAGEAKAEIIYRDDLVTAFRDARPAAPVHVLIVPNQHIPSIRDIQPEDEVLIGHLFTAANRVAEQEGISSSGYRMVINQGADAGQSVFHIHMHVLGGQPLGLMRH
jgi:histidine triad (HIT) family protein